MPWPRQTYFRHSSLCMQAHAANLQWQEDVHDEWKHSFLKEFQGVRTIQHEDADADKTEASCSRTIVPLFSMGKVDIDIKIWDLGSEPCTNSLNHGSPLPFRPQINKSCFFSEKVTHFCNVFPGKTKNSLWRSRECGHAKEVWPICGILLLWFLRGCFCVGLKFWRQRCPHDYYCFMAPNWCWFLSYFVCQKQSTYACLNHHRDNWRKRTKTTWTIQFSQTWSQYHWFVQGWFEFFRPKPGYHTKNIRYGGLRMTAEHTRVFNHRSSVIFRIGRARCHDSRVSCNNRSLPFPMQQEQTHPKPAKGNEVTQGLYNTGNDVCVTSLDKIIHTRHCSFRLSWLWGEGLLSIRRSWKNSRFLSEFELLAFCFLLIKNVFLTSWKPARKEHFQTLVHFVPCPFRWCASKEFLQLSEKLLPFVQALFHIVQVVSGALSEPDERRPSEWNLHTAAGYTLGHHRVLFKCIESEWESQVGYTSHRYLQRT